MDNRHPNYMGDVGLAINPELGSYIKSADLILCVGARLGENTTGGYSLLEAPNAANPLIHVHPCLLYTSPSPRDATLSRMPSSA